MRDPDYTPFRGRLVDRPPRLELLETCWRLVGRTGRPIDCGIYQTAAGLEVRASYSDADLVRSQLVVDVEAGRELAEEWKQTAIAKGSFAELPK